MFKSDEMLQAVALYVDPELSGSGHEQERARLEQKILGARRRYCLP